MAKISVKKFNLKGVVGSLAGGAATSFGIGFMPTDWDPSMKSGVMAVGGAAISAFMKGDFMKSIGGGIIGAAGYRLTESLMGSFPITSGIASPNLAAIPGQNAIAASNWIRTRRVSGIGDTETANPLPAGQQNVM
jgi:hypothetical protein